MWELYHKESWVTKNRCFWIVLLGKIFESPLDCKEIKPVNPKGNQSWIFIGRTDAEAQAPVLWPPGVNSWLIWKDPDAGKDWRQEEKGTTEDEMVGWHHRLNGHEFEQALGVGDGQGSLACCSPWDRKESDTTERLSRTEHPHQSILLIGSKKSFENANGLNNSHNCCCLAWARSSLYLFSSSAWHQPLPGLPYSAILLLISSSLTTGPLFVMILLAVVFFDWLSSFYASEITLPRKFFLGCLYL